MADPTTTTPPPTSSNVARVLSCTATINTTASPSRATNPLVARREIPPSRSSAVLDSLSRGTQRVPRYSVTYAAVQSTEAWTDASR